MCQLMGAVCGSIVPNMPLVAAPFCRAGGILGSAAGRDRYTLDAEIKTVKTVVRQR